MIYRTKIFKPSIITYYNSNHNPDIQITIEDKILFFNDEKLSEFYPKFSQNMKYVAFFRNKKTLENNWEIVVVKTDKPNTSNIIHDAKKYDIQETAFFFHDSLQWMNNKLYYQKDTDDDAKYIYQYDPVSKHVKRILFEDNIFRKDATYHSRYSENEVETIKCELELLIHRIGWFQIAFLNGKRIVVAESTLSTHSKTDAFTIPFDTQHVRRIAIFQEK